MLIIRPSLQKREPLVGSKVDCRILTEIELHFAVAEPRQDLAMLAALSTEVECTNSRARQTRMVDER